MATIIKDSRKICPDCYESRPCDCGVAKEGSITNIQVHDTKWTPNEVSEHFKDMSHCWKVSLFIEELVRWCDSVRDAKDSEFISPSLYTYVETISAKGGLTAFSGGIFADPIKTVKELAGNCLAYKTRHDLPDDESLGNLPVPSGDVVALKPSFLDAMKAMMEEGLLKDDDIQDTRVNLTTVWPGFNK